MSLYRMYRVRPEPSAAYLYVIGVCVCLRIHGSVYLEALARACIHAIT